MIVMGGSINKQNASKFYDKVINLNFETFPASGRRFPPRALQLNASTGGAGPLPIITTLLAEPIPVVNVTVETDGMRDPVALLNFTSIVSLPVGISVTLNFKIKRSLNGGAPISVGSTYTFSTLVTALEAEAFSFQFFDNNLTSGTYTYSIEISTNSIIDITPGLTVNNATLSVLAIDNNPV